ncbi:GNAT family N-acetyltransferase [Nocardioides rubriscoriae]|uniref:GNAT family N-acetyltransferase n=1 Tax=Nocardioides rubriscoriae TaxID=642762 RepID=UPI001FE34D7D|nr:GNAT family N-acetyltransferase [Nocardioides rubriscoriae]
MSTLRPATPDDMSAIADLWHAGWHDAHPGHVPDELTASRTVGEFHARVPGRVGDTTVAEVDGAVAGFTMVVGDEVEQVYVAAGHRGSGVAEVLLDHAVRRVAAAGHDEAWLAVVEGNARARRFYERRGWRDEGALPYEVVSGGRTLVSPCRRYVFSIRQE